MCNNTNNNVIKALSKPKLHVESIPAQHLGSIWVWELVRRLSPLGRFQPNCMKVENTPTPFKTGINPSEYSMDHMKTI